MIELIFEDLALQMAAGSALRLEPMLLLGSPGVGKTAFASALARTLDFNLHQRSMAETSGGFVLTGSNSRWFNAYQGTIATAILATPNGRAPLLFLD